jgi:transcriptional regulator with XRE-family HTH domain
MTNKKQKQQPATALGRALENYRQQHDMKILDLAEYLSVSDRTVSRWISGETILNDVRELKRIANLLEVEPESLGIVASLSLPLTPEQVDATVELVWSLIHQARYAEGRAIIERLLRDLTSQIETEDPIYLSGLARAHHVAGHVTSEGSRTDKVLAAFSHFQETEKIARIIKDDTLLNIALTYEGDMLRRKGDIRGGLQYLEEARDHTPNADKEARGNSLQLLARASLNSKDTYQFEQAMAEAEELSADTSSFTGSTHGFYSLGAVYEEYGKSYGWLGQTEQASKYLDLARQHLPKTVHWELVLETAQAMALVRGGEVSEGSQLAVHAALHCQRVGNYRMLERVYSIQHYLEQLTLDIGNAHTIIRDALVNGPIEYI